MAVESGAGPGEFAIPDALPVLPLRDMVPFPLTAFPLAVGQPRSVRLVDEVMRGNRLLALVAQRDAKVEPAMPKDLYPVGTVGVIHQLGRVPDGKVRLLVQGIERIRLLEWIGTEPYLVARIEIAGDHTGQATEVDALRRAVVDIFRRLVEASAELPDELAAAMENITDPRHVVYFVASVVPLEVAARQELLEMDPVTAKLRRLIDLLQREVAVRELGRKITTDTEERLSKKQREFYLREQLQSIQRELGEDAGDDSGATELRRRIEEASLPDEARREAERELGRLAGISPSSPEHGMIRTYLEWMATLPWSKLGGATIDIHRAREVLDEDHFDLEKIKERILEYLAVKKLRQERAGRAGHSGPGEAPVPAEPPPVTGDSPAREPILCFVGPPGVGKTSLGQSIARALGRRFVRMSLGGVRDEAEIRGHRRTYIGALPGRIIQGLRRAETRDPVFMLDEIDKIGADWRGDPSSALLEVLDPAQNHTFVDNYLAVSFDLSQVLFIATANTLDTIPGPLRDRMEILVLSGYTDEEKIGIARQYLIPKVLAAHGLATDELSFEPEAIRQIVRGYTREAGVRNLDREIAAVARKVARRLAEGQRESVRITADSVVAYLGQPRFFDEVAERTTRPGIATGLAWTPTGGDVLFVEVTMMPSTEERLVLTGMLGDVMRESAQAAVSYVWSNAESLDIDPKLFESKTIHVHVPAGAIPKDGPSAGVTIMTALASLATRRPVQSKVAMTGEITLRGKVLPVGGIKEKVLAAHRTGIRSVILPSRNERDLEEVPEELRRQLSFIFVDDAEEVLRHALTPIPSRRAPAGELRRASRATRGAPPLAVRAQETALMGLPKPGRSMRTLRYALVVTLLSACASPYYNVMEQLGFPKRDILVDRVEEARDSQEQAAEQFKDALERFIAVTGFKGGALQEKYDQLESEYEQSEARATDVHRRVAGVEDVAEALFDEWEAELDQYTSAPLRRSSERRLQETRAQYGQLIRAMKRAEAKMAPVLAAFHDQVLFLKHNLNAQAIASLKGNLASIESDIAVLIREMEASIREANRFIDAMNVEQVS